MSIITADFVFRLSGGSSNANGNASLGGVKSSELVSSSIDGLFDPVSAAEALAGDVEYRCIYLHNANATDTMTNARVWIQTNTPLAGTTVAIGIGTAAVNGTEQTIANEGTAPTGVTFSAPTDADTGLAAGSVPAGQHKSLWIRYTASAGTGASADDAWTLGFDSETV